MHLNQLNDDQTYFVILSVAGRETHWAKGRSIKKNWRNGQLQKLGETSPILPGYSLVECEKGHYIGVKAFQGDPAIGSAHTARIVQTDPNVSQARTDMGHVFIPLPGTQPKKKRKPIVSCVPDAPCEEGGCPKCGPILESLQIGAKLLTSTLHLAP